ncbi:bifunctional DNA-binding transcriptional regulator/O6-methylguanine-DNA methyltransferase Ada [Pendulispora albinea]|uniref:Bifunctional DNA-binding transcriptional regulator/O6-methylguanine-DNA methyltransferase Ada n=1 Tax=Pendulispora albinea TaxID=2741071 RepID=A0ABZ2LT02_9BACT
MMNAMVSHPGPASRSETLSLATHDGRWDAVVRRDRAADGSFFYSVKTTGVYCRPSCGSRQPRRENVEFHTTVGEAERAGFRPCKRCHPDESAWTERHAAAVAKACRMIEEADEMPSLDDLADGVGMSRFHFHRVFKKLTGVTPKAYADAHRAGRVQHQLTQATTVTEAIYGAGFQSNGRFYATSSKMLGMTPTAFRKGGRGTSIRFAVGECWLGSVLVAATDKGVCAVLFGDNPELLVRDLQDRFPQAQFVGGDLDFESMVAKVIGHVEAPEQSLDLPLDVRGSAFQKRVWQALREIPPGSTASYATVAQRIGQPKAVRAVAQACASNAIAVAIPCHRVVRTDGSLSGYRWGVERKRALLEREREREAAS